MQTIEERTPSPEAVEYVRAVHADVRSWYANAEAKGQHILTFDGVFIAFISGSLFAKRSDLNELTANFGVETWALLAIMAGFMTLSIVCAELCLWSRHYLPWTLNRKLSEAHVNVADARTYSAEFLWFFQHIHHLDRDQLAIRLAAMDGDSELRALAANSHALA